jgi:hypothetical protein
MGKVWVRELTGGLDTRRLPETTPGGLLIKGQDGHINAGGEFEKRAAFVAAYTLPAGTIGLAYDSSSLVVFGHDTEPAMPAGVAYQQLAIDPAQDLVEALSWDLFANKIYVSAEFLDGTIAHFYDGTEVEDWFDGRASASFRVTAGTLAGSAQLDSLTVGGVEVLSGAVAWGTSHVATAAAIAANINAHTSTPNYEATAVDDRVNIIAALAGTGANGRAVTFTLSGNLEVTPAEGLVLSGGVTSAAFTPGNFVKTIGSKMYALNDGTMHFSGIRQPTQWTTDVTGAGFYDMSQEAAGAEQLLALANYQGLVAVLAENVVLIFYVDPDPDLVTKRQILENTGTVSPKSVTTFGDADVFYLSLSGLRSLKARDSSNAAATTDLGVPVDSLITAKLAGMTADERRDVIGLINPVDGRFWLCFPDGQIFVFSFYPNAKVSAWTTYETGFPIDAAVVFKRRVYLRSANTIYVYGGLDSGAGLTYDSTVAKAWLPAFDADKPDELKQWRGIDAAVEGTWDVYVAQQPTDLDVRELCATITETTYNRPRVPFEAQCTHASPHFESKGSGQAKLSSMMLHYDGGEDG